MELYILIGLVAVVLVLQVVLLLKKPKSENTATNTNYESNFQHIESYIADEFSRSQKRNIRKLKQPFERNERPDTRNSADQHAAKRKAQRQP